jgi:hypothetical protein
MKQWFGRAVVGLVLGLGSALGADAPTAPDRPPADFKIVVAMYGLRKEPILTTELVVRHGRVFQFNSEATAEIIIHDPRTERIELFDMDRMVQTDLTWKMLDDAEDRLRKAIVQAIEEREKEGGRANRVSAAMSRNLIDPHFATSFDEKTNHLRLTNPSVEVDAIGEPEGDAGRLRLIARTLVSSIKLESARNVEQIPPFPRLETLRMLTSDHHLRPTETTFLYRLAGPPRKLRWTYRLVSSLTDRELEALARIGRLREKAPHLRYERYEEGREKPKE